MVESMEEAPVPPAKPVRKRAPNACMRCRQQKIRCGGGTPCSQCTKKKVECVLDDRMRKVLVTRNFIRDLEERLATREKENGDSQVQESSTVTIEAPNTAASNEIASNLATVGSDHVEPDETMTSQPQTNSVSRHTSPGPPLINPLAHGASAYIPDASGQPVYLGTSSNWSFCRRVLALTHERTMGSPLISDNLLFEGKVYALDWDGQSSAGFSIYDSKALPSSDYAMYLINTVKFHCGQIFHLFDERVFMEQFARFHESTSDNSQTMRLWHAHYLLVLAFGKAFLARNNKCTGPPGADFFVQAMNLLPNLSFLCTDPVETIEILCCAALYLQSVDYRSQAYQVIGQALRIALAHGMHTDMQSQYIHDPTVQRCRKVWWTVYVIDRQTSSSMGLPSAIRDEDISAGLPSQMDSSHKVTALDIQVRLCRVLALISNTVYGVEGRLDARYISSTKAALRGIASVTDQLNENFDISASGTAGGMSRLSSYLHLLRHQCIIVATRPLLYTLIEARAAPRGIRRRQYRNVQALLQMCVDSAVQVLKLLGSLQEQGLLESFLTFDLDATFTSAVVLLMAASIDPTLVGPDNYWPHQAYGILDEFTSRGNLIAGFMKAELQQLETMLEQVSLPPQQVGPTMGIIAPRDNSLPSLDGEPQRLTDVNVGQIPGQEPTNMDFSWEEIDWRYPITTEQMFMMADSLEADGLHDWLSMYTT